MSAAGTDAVPDAADYVTRAADAADAADAGRTDAARVAAQLGRAPRNPWRVAVRCRWSRPAVIVSPSTLADGTPFPNLAWLTCPWLAEAVAAEESAGGAAADARRAAADPAFAAARTAADAAVRARRAAESGGRDACATVGIAGQRDPLGVKCLHAHVALALLGVADPVGEDVVSRVQRWCDDDRCAGLGSEGSE